MDPKDDDSYEEKTPVSMKEAVVMLEKIYIAFEKCNSIHMNEMQLIA